MSHSSSNLVFSYDPNQDKQQEHRPRWRKRQPRWVAPEHAKVAMEMERKYPVDDRGQRLEGRDKELVLDKRPTIMKPERKPIVLF